MLTLLFLLVGGVETQPLSLPEALEAAAATAQEAEAEEPKQPKWTGSVTAGGKITTGNSESRRANVSADAELKREKDKTTLGFLWLFDENANNATNDYQITERKTTGKGQYDYFLSEKTYALGQASLQGDYTSDLDLRQIYGLGLGRQLSESEKLALGAELGVSYVNEAYGVSSSDKEYVAARIAYTLAWQISKSWQFDQKAAAYPSLENSDDFYTNVDSRLKVAFGESMFGQLQWLYDWNNNPSPGKEKVDNQFLLSIGWKI